MAYGTVDGSVGPKTGNWEARPGADECVLIDVDGVLGTAEFFTGGYCRRAEQQGLLSSEGWGLEDDPGDDETEGGGGGGGEGPPTGSDEIRLVFDAWFFRHHIRVWTYGLVARIKVGDEEAFVEMPNLNTLVDAVADIKRKYGGG